MANLEILRIGFVFGFGGAIGAALGLIIVSFVLGIMKNGRKNV